MSIVTKDISSYNFAKKVLPYTLDNSSAASKDLTLTPGSLLELDFSNMYDGVSAVTISSITVDGADENNVAIGDLLIYPTTRSIIWPEDVTWLENGEDGYAPTVEDGKKYYFNIMEDASGKIFINLSYSYSYVENVEEEVTYNSEELAAAVAATIALLEVSYDADLEAAMNAAVAAWIVAEASGTSSDWNTAAGVAEVAREAAAAAAAWETMAAWEVAREAAATAATAL